MVKSKINVNKGDADRVARSSTDGAVARACSTCTLVAAAMATATTLDIKIGFC